MMISPPGRPWAEHFIYFLVLEASWPPLGRAAAGPPPTGRPAAARARPMPPVRRPPGRRPPGRPPYIHKLPINHTAAFMLIIEGFLVVYEY